MRIGIVVDSCCDLPKDFIEANGIIVMPITLRIGELLVEDRRDPQETLDFYARHLDVKSEDFAESIPYSARQIEELFLGRLVLDYDYVFCLTITGGRSAIYDHAMEASRTILTRYKEIRRQAGIPERFGLAVLSSRNMFAGQGVQAVEAVRLIQAGGTPSEIGNRLRALVDRTHTYMVPADLYHIYKRASKKGDKSIGWGSYTLGSLLDVKPILYCNLDQTGPVDKVRGFATGVEKLFGKAAGRVKQGLDVPCICISYGGPVDDVPRLPGYAAFAAAARSAGIEILVSPMSKTAAVNVGPGALALGYVADGPSIEKYDMNELNMKHWRLAIEDSGIAVAILDKAGESANSLSAEVMGEFGRLLDQLDLYPPKGLIVRSGKEAGFIAGADIGEFTQLDTPAKGRALVARGWELFNRLAAVRYPTLALVRGHCLGGGLELALACRYLLAVDEPGTKMGLPEVMLGIFPGWGGMLRLPQRIGAPAALDLMLTGKTLDAKRAKRMGLADDCVPPRVMEAAARQLLLSGQARRPLPFKLRMMNGPLKGVVASGARKQVAKKARPEHYPAPYAIIDIWAKHDGNALVAPEIIDRIISSPTARNLVRVFFLQERMKAFGKESDFKAKRVHVIGAGVMGGDIAAWCALRGMTVTLQDQTLERIAPALQRAHKLFARRLREPLRVRAAFDRLIPDPNGDGVAHADVVIEAIFENVEAKHALFKSLEPRMKPGALLATNTSSLRLEDLRTALQRPERLVGIHFFNPVAMMPLVEVVAAEGADPAAVNAACAFVKQIDKLPLPVKSAPGFLVNAVLAPYMLEAMRAVDEGISPETVDEAMLAFGMPMGPIELADTVGLDIAMAAGKQLAGDAEAPRCLLAKAEKNQLGKKSGHGFYAWNDGKAQKGAAGSVPAGLAERLARPLIERTRKLVADGIVADADLADAGVIFGTGFAPFTGGPLNIGKSA